jgi:hypothetical protein
VPNPVQQVTPIDRVAAAVERELARQDIRVPELSKRESVGLMDRLGERLCIERLSTQSSQVRPPQVGGG